MKEKNVQKRSVAPGQRTPADLLTKIIFCCFSILALLIFVNKEVYLFELLPSIVAWVGSVAIVLLAVLVIWKRNQLYLIADHWVTRLDRHLTNGSALLLIALLSMVTKLAAIAVFGIDSLSHPDIETYVVTSQELVNTGLASSYGEYCWSFSHMYWFAVFLMPVIAFFGINNTALAVYMAIVSTASVLFLFDTVRWNFSRKKALAIFAIFVLLPSQILLPSYIIHEHALLFFLSLTVWLAFRVLPSISHDKKILRGLIFGLSAVSLFLAAQMNAAALVAAIAVCIVYLIRGLAGRSMKAMMKALCKIVAVLVVISIGGSLFSSWQQTHSVIREDFMKTDKVTWTLFVGSNAETAGQWSYEDTQLNAGYAPTATEDEIQEYRQQLLIDRYENLISQPGTLVKLVKEKFSTIWSCFVYPISYSNETIRNATMQQLYNRFLFKPLTCLEYGISVLLVIVLLASIIGGRRKENDFGLFTVLFLLGNTAMLLLTECNNKYTMAVQPFFIIACLAIYGRENKKELE